MGEIATDLPASEQDEPLHAPESVPAEPPGEDDTEPEQDDSEPADGLSEPQDATPAADVEKAMDKLAREATRHANRVSEIMGEDAQLLVACELCAPGIPGFHFAFPPDEDTRRAVKLALGEPPEPEYLPADNAAACTHCDGLGKRLSGSKVPDQRVLLCSACGGKGWQGSAVGYTPPPVEGQNGPAGDVAQLPPEDMPATDPWGRTPDDVDYGRLPNYVRA